MRSHVNISTGGGGWQVLRGLMEYNYCNLGVKLTLYDSLSKYNIR